MEEDCGKERAKLWKDSAALAQIKNNLPEWREDIKEEDCEPATSCQGCKEKHVCVRARNEEPS